jgi:glutamate decarboxylase
MKRIKESAQANLESLYRIFTVPEAPDSTLGGIDQAITDNVTGSLQEHIVALERELKISRPISPPRKSLKTPPTFLISQSL